MARIACRLPTGSVNDVDSACAPAAEGVIVLSSTHDGLFAFAAE